MVKRKSIQTTDESNLPPNIDNDVVDSAFSDVEINNEEDSSDGEQSIGDSDLYSSELNSSESDDEDELDNEDFESYDDNEESGDENENDSDSSVYKDSEDEEQDELSDSENDQTDDNCNNGEKTENVNLKTLKNIEIKQSNSIENGILQKELKKKKKKKQQQQKKNNNSKMIDSGEQNNDVSSDEEQRNGKDNRKSVKVATECHNKKAAASKSIAKQLANSDQISGSKVDSKVDEYEEDTSDEEDIRNTIGNVPLEWYADYAHLGYDWDGNKIMKPKQGDKLDDFLKRVEDPNFWRTVFEPYTNQNVILTDEDIQLIQRIQAQRVPDAAFDEYAPWIEWFTSEVEKMPIRKFPEHKRSFIPSRSEAKKVSKLVHALKMGWIKTRQEQAKLRAQKDPQFYMIWNADDTPEHMRRIHKHIPAPKRHLPGHAESYNPPAEYLFDRKELKEWQKQQTTPWKRKLHFIPEKYDSLRQVPAYSRYIRERFQRCLDLYLCPRAIKMKLQIEAEDLVPKLPSPRDLQPFPTSESIIYRGHTDMIRSITVELKGQYLASGSDDQTVKSSVSINKFYYTTKVL